MTNDMKNEQYKGKESPQAFINDSTCDSVRMSKLENAPRSELHKQEIPFFQRLKENYSPSILLFFIICAFNGGIGLSRSLCTINIYKEIFNLEPSQVQSFDVILQMVVFLRFPVCLCIDLRIISNRRYILFFCGLGQAMCLVAIFTEVANTAHLFFASLICDCLFGLIIVSLKETLLVEQSRKDIVNGLGDITTIATVFSAIGSAIGCVIGTCLIDMQQPRMAFTICFFFVITQAIVSICLSDDIDNNPLATGKDNELLKYEAQQRLLNPERYGEGQDVDAPPMKQRIEFKLKSIWKCLNILSVRKFILFQILQGLCMPVFPAFDYYFSLDQLKIPLDMMNLQNLWLGWICFMIPVTYQKFFVRKDFVYMIFLSQMIYIVADSMGLSLALGWNASLGIPTKAAYLISSIVQVLDNGFNQFAAYIFFGKVVPQGVESTTVGLLFYTISLNNYTLRPLLGLILNQTFYHVTRKEMENYWYLRAVCLICDFLPFLFMFYLCPSVKEANELQQTIANQNNQSSENEYDDNNNMNFNSDRDHESSTEEERLRLIDQ